MWGKLLITDVSDPLLCTVFTITFSDYVQIVWPVLNDSHCSHICDVAYKC